MITLKLNNENARRYALQIIMNAPDGHEVIVRQQRRSLPQNDLLHAVIDDIARQVEWHGKMRTKAEWKIILTAALTRQEVVPGIDGGTVVMGKSTAEMSKSEVTDLIELAYAFGAQQGVMFREVR